MRKISGMFPRQSSTPATEPQTLPLFIHLGDGLEPRQPGTIDRNTNLSGRTGSFKNIQIFPGIKINYEMLVAIVLVLQT